MTTLVDAPLAPSVVLAPPGVPDLNEDRTVELTPVRRRRRLPIPPEYLPVTVLILAVVTLQAFNIAGYPGLSDDEGTYLAQAWAVQQGQGLAHYTYWYDHPPGGWIQIAFLSWIPAMLFGGEPAVATARSIMPLITGISAFLLYVLARRLALRPWVGLLAVAVFGISPLAVSLQRQLFLDNIAVAWMLGAFVLALSPRKHLWHHLSAGACAAVAVLSKETMLIAVPALALALWRGSDPTTRKFSLAAFVSALGLLGVFYPLYALIKGELFPGDDHVSLLGAVFFQVADRASSGHILSSGSGANTLLRDWLYYDPVLVIGGTAACVLGLAFRRLWIPALAGTMFILVAMRPSGYLPAMYIAQALPFFALAIAGLVDRATDTLTMMRRRMRRNFRWSVWLASAVLAGLAVGVTAPTWYEGDRRAMTAKTNEEYGQALSWVRGNVANKSETRIVVDDVLWLDMVRAGFEPGLGAVWFYKVDLDSAVQKTFPNGYRDADYIISTPIIRSDPNSLPTVRDMLLNSRVVATFGDGEALIEVRQIVKEAP